MKKLNEILGRFAKSLNKDAFIKESVISIIKNKTGVALKPEKINLKDGVLEVEASAAAKNEIRLKEDSIKCELKISRILYK